MPSEFAYCVCQAGAETALRAEAAARLPGWRLSFSRPGFVTFKLPSATTVERFDPPPLTFARARGLSFGEPPTGTAGGGYDPARLAAAVWSSPLAAELLARGPVALHVWRREAELPGEGGAEPQQAPLVREALEAIRAAAPDGALAGMPRGGGDQESAPNEAAPRRAGPPLCLDVVLVDTAQEVGDQSPLRWWLGAHPIRTRSDRWPGGTLALELPEHAVSRAYLKIVEAIRWAGLPTTPGERWMELGCAPGGAAQALLDAGMHVVGVDPAEIDPVVLEDPNFTHVRRRAEEVRLDDLDRVRWLAADLNAAPDTTLAAVERLATSAQSTLRGLVLTIKLLEPAMAAPEAVAERIRRVRSWGFGDVRSRQLAHHRREYVIVAVRSRAQRRVRRPAGRRGVG